jgi:hypothetical protein
MNIKNIFWVICFVLPINFQLQSEFLDDSKFSDKSVSLFDKPVDFSGSSGEICNPHNLDEIRIGLLVPDTLENPVDRNILQAAELTINEANSAGGFQGIPFRIIQRWGYDPWGADSKEMINLVYQDNVWAVVGSIEGDATHTEGIIVHLHQDDIKNLLTLMKQNGTCIPCIFTFDSRSKKRNNDMH